MIQSIRSNQIIKREYKRVIKGSNIKLDSVLKEVNNIVYDSVLLEVNCKSCINSNINYSIVLNRKYNLKKLEIKVN